MRKANGGIIGLAIEIAFMSIGSLIYSNGFGAGPQGVVSMIAGVTVAAIGLLIGGVLGITSMMKREGKSVAAVLASVLPVAILAVVFIRRIGPL